MDSFQARCPVLPNHPTRKSVGYFGVVRLRDGRFFFCRETDRFNAVICWQLLKELRGRSTRAGRKGVIIVDFIRYRHAHMHRDWRQAQAEHSALDFLPPSYPGLTPWSASGK